MKQEIKPLSRDKVLRDMNQWLSAENNFADDNETLWTMFVAVVTSSSWGTSEYGGPVWLMDFSLDNLKKLFPDNPWLQAMEEELRLGRHELTDRANSQTLREFSNWFELKARDFIETLGLGNVLLKLDTGWDGSLSFYGQGTFLTAIQRGIAGYIYRPMRETMMDWNFSLKESEIVQSGEFLTYLSNGWVDSQPVMIKKFPDFRPKWDIRYNKKHSKYGECYWTGSFSKDMGFAISETIQEKFLIMFVYDVMEAKITAQNLTEKQRNTRYGVILKGNTDIFSYPPMKYDTYIDERYSILGHIKPTKDVYRKSSRSLGDIEIKVELPKIDAEHGEFWHRQFPLKQHWRTLEDFEN